MTANSAARTRLPLALPGVLLLAICGQAHAAAGTFRGIGSLPGTNSSWGYGISSDGSSVVGRSGTNFYYGNTGHGYYWHSSDNSMIDLTPLDADSTAWGISGDGSQMVGVRHTGSGSGHSFECDSSGTSSGSSGGGADELFAISADGTAMVGYSLSSGHPGTPRAQMWTPDQRWQFIDSPSMTFSHAYGVNANGAVAVGQGTFDGIGARAFRWTAATGPVNIGAPAGGVVSDARGVSADGSIVVGMAGNRAFRWTSAAGMQDLGALPGAATSFAYAISADGSTIVGTSYVTADARNHAFVWTAASGMQDLQTLLGSAVPAGWRIVEARATTPDGSTIVGTAITPLNEPQAFIATLPTTPACRADANGSGAVDVQDIFDFLTSWFAAAPSADFNNSGAIDVQDIFDYLSDWFAGC